PDLQKSVGRAQARHATAGMAHLSDWHPTCVVADDFDSKHELSRRTCKSRRWQDEMPRSGYGARL
ncbi:MAG: hypothetical protein QMD17_15080, partial [Rhodocyclaceae bacterium]|nr:hypothetical protein [Rhodocyclaceae bacterium]